MAKVATRNKPRIRVRGGQWVWEAPNARAHCGAHVRNQSHKLQAFCVYMDRVTGKGRYAPRVSPRARVE